jgi:hypothetical protein
VAWKKHGKANEGSWAGRWEEKVMGHIQRDRNTRRNKIGSNFTGSTKALLFKKKLMLFGNFCALKAECMTITITIKMHENKHTRFWFLHSMQLAYSWEEKKGGE